MATWRLRQSEKQMAAVQSGGRVQRTLVTRGSAIQEERMGRLSFKERAHVCGDRDCARA